MSQRERTMNKKEYINNSQKVNAPSNPVAEIFQQQVGALCEIPAIALSAKNNIMLYCCEVTDSPYKLVFTTGLLFLQNAELVICLPKEWPVRRFDATYLLEETFPVDFLKEIIKKMEKKNTAFVLKDGLVLDRNKSPWNKLNWMESVRGMLVLDHQWGDPAPDCETASDETDEEDFKLFTLFPLWADQDIPQSKEINEWLHNKRNASWAEAAIPFNHKINLQMQLNEALAQHNLEAVKKSVESGAEINYPYIEWHCSFGHFSEETLLKHALSDKKNEHIVRYLVERGAKVPKEALACMINWGSFELYKFLIDHGADIDAKSVGMTALERARAFKNTEGYQDLLKLGAKDRKKLK